MASIVCKPRYSEKSLQLEFSINAKKGKQSVRNSEYSWDRTFLAKELRFYFLLHVTTTKMRCSAITKEIHQFLSTYKKVPCQI